MTNLTSWIKENHSPLKGQQGDFKIEAPVGIVGLTDWLYRREIRFSQKEGIITFFLNPSLVEDLGKYL
jgi:hypothetical protein